MGIRGFRERAKDPILFNWVVREKRDIKIIILIIFSYLHAQCALYLFYFILTLPLFVFLSFYYINKKENRRGGGMLRFLTEGDIRGDSVTKDGSRVWCSIIFFLW